MKCPQCGLNNLSHVSQCVKCGAILVQPVSAWTPKQCYPPRAGRLHWLWAAFYASRRKWRRLPDDFAAEAKIGADQKFAERVGIQLQLVDEKYYWPYNIIPGWGTVLAGRRWQGGITFGLWFIFLVLGIFFFGLFEGNVFFGLMMGIHFAAFYDLYPISERRWPWLGRVRALLLLLVGIGIIYGFIFNVTTYWVRGYTMVLAGYAPALQLNDFLLVTRPGTCRRGDLVLFHRTAENVGRNRRGLVIRLAPGTFCDRVIGLPGETIKLSQGNIYINGQKLDSAFFPLRHFKLVGEWEMKLPEDTYFIVNSYRRIEFDILAEYGKVPRSDIQGRIFMIWQPLDRRQFINPPVPAEKVKSNG